MLIYFYLIYSSLYNIASFITMADDVKNSSSAEFTNTSLLAFFSLTEGVAWCSSFAVVSFFIVVGNVLAIIVFGLNKSLRKKSFLLVINMACADLMLGSLSLPLFIYQLGGDFELWPKQWNFSWSLFYRVIDTVCAQSSVITATFIAIERFYATGWPLKHRTIARRRAYYILIFLTWLFSIALSAAIIGSLYKSVYVAVVIWVSHASILTLTICAVTSAFGQSLHKEEKAFEARTAELPKTSDRRRHCCW